MITIAHHRSRGWSTVTVSILCAAAAWQPHPVGASQVLALDLPEMTAAAERIVVAEVLSVKSAWNTSGTQIHTTIDLQVAETWKGAVPGDGRIRVRQPGGAQGGIETRVHGMPAFAVGERAVLFLRAASVLGMAQGKRSLRFDTGARQWMVDAPDRSAVVLQDRAGRTRPAPSLEPIRLDDLRLSVRSLLKPK